MNRNTLRTGAAIVAGIGVLAGASGALAVSSTMPAAAPTGADSSAPLQYSVPKGKLLQKKAVSYFYMSNGGGQVKITAPTFKGYDTFQTVTITPPSGQTVIQGMSTISGGDLGSMIIQSTSSSSSTYTIKLKYPGSQGTPGTLTFRLQMGMKN